MSLTRVRIRDWDDMVKEYEIEDTIINQGCICTTTSNNSNGIPTKYYFIDNMRKYCGEEFDVFIYGGEFMIDIFTFTIDMCVPLDVLRDEKLTLLGIE